MIHRMQFDQWMLSPRLALGELTSLTLLLKIGHAGTGRPGSPVMTRSKAASWSCRQPCWRCRPQGIPADLIGENCLASVIRVCVLLDGRSGSALTGTLHGLIEFERPALRRPGGWAIEAMLEVRDAGLAVRWRSKSSTETLRAVAGLSCGGRNRRDEHERGPGDRHGWLS